VAGRPQLSLPAPLHGAAPLTPAPARPFAPARRRQLITHDWLWSAGAHPLSWTSTGTAYSQLHIDALHR
jgi:hypothetical protein